MTRLGVENSAPAGLIPLPAAVRTAAFGWRGVPSGQAGASGLSRSGTENAHGQVADLAAGLWCETCGREHQPRERAVPCLICRRATFRPHAVCGVCELIELVT